MGLFIMKEQLLLEAFRREFNAYEDDNIHEKVTEPRMGSMAPKKVYIDGEMVGCVDLRKLPGTIDGFVELAFIYIFQQEKGYGSTVLNRICELADMLNLEVNLEAVPIRGLGREIEKSKLQAFYRSFGFKHSEVRGSNMMTRYPNR